LCQLAALQNTQFTSEPSNSAISFHGILKWNGNVFSSVKTDSTASLQAGVIIPGTSTAVIGGDTAGWLHQVP
jgi:hypothetical protein